MTNSQNLAAAARSADHAAACSLSTLAEKLNAPHTWRAEGRAATDLVLSVDLGTSTLVTLVLDRVGVPVAGAMECAQVVRDGLLLDYLGALDITRKLYARIVGHLRVAPQFAATGCPPRTGTGNAQLTKHLVESLGVEVVRVVDEPVAANSVLSIGDGAVVDVGGGTTGIAIFCDGKLVDAADEPTGGRHFTLVIAGHYGISVEEAEALKKGPMQPELVPLVTPVMEKVASIVERAIEPYRPSRVCLVGGAGSFTGFSSLLERELGIPVEQPPHPQLVTPLGIGRECCRALASL